MRVVSPDQPRLAVARRRRDAAERTATDALGWRISYGAHALDVPGERTKSIRERADDINDAFADPTVDAVICAAGGGQTREVLPYLDYDLIAAHPKTVIGQCANVALALALLSQARLVSLLGPCFANHLGDIPEPYAETVAGLGEATSTRHPIALRPVGLRAVTYREPDPVAVRERTMGGGWRWARPGRAAGPLIGGDLGTTMMLLHGPYFPSLTGFVLLVDANALPIEVIDLGMAELDDAGLLSRAAGVMFAERRRVDAVDDPDGDMADLVAKWFGHRDIPVLVGADCGHMDPVWTVAIGGTVALDSATDTVVMAPP